MNVIKSVWVWVSSITFVLLGFPISGLLWLISLLFDHNRRMNNRWMVIQGVVLTKMSPFWKVTVEGREKIDNRQPYVIVPNHQSMLDIVFFNMLYHRLRWVSKIEVFKVPVLGGICLSMSVIPIRQQLLTEAIDSPRRAITTASGKTFFMSSRKKEEN